VAKARERFVARLDAAGAAGARRDAVLDVFEDYLRSFEETPAVEWVDRLQADSRLDGSRSSWCCERSSTTPGGDRRGRLPRAGSR